MYPSPITVWDKIHEKNIYMGKGKWISVREVNGGWIHACNTLDDAKLWLKRIIIYLIIIKNNHFIGL